VNNQAQQECQGVSARQNRVIEAILTGLSLPPTLALSLHNHTEVWMWLMWFMGSIIGSLWSIRVRAWGLLLLNITYLAINAMGLIKLLGFSFA
jgi:hypothetical protein